MPSSASQRQDSRPPHGGRRNYNRPRNHWFLIVLICISLGGLIDALLQTSPPSEHSEVPTLSAAIDSVGIDHALEFLEEPTSGLTADATLAPPQARLWQPVQQPPFNRLAYDSVVWLRFPLRLASGDTTQWLINIRWPFLDLLELYVRDTVHGRWIPQVSATPGQARNDSIDRVPFVLPLDTGGQTNLEVYLRVHGAPQLLVPISIWQQNAMRRAMLTRNLQLGLFLGVLVAMCAYNAMLYAFTREANFAYYALYVGSIIGYSLTVSGLGVAYLWGQYTWFSQHAWMLTSSLGFLCAALFIRNFLELPKRGGWMNRLAQVMLIYWMIVIGLYVLLGQSWLLIPEYLGAIVSCIVGLAIPVIIWRNGDASGKYLTVAWSLLIASTFLLMLGLCRIIPYDPAQIEIQIGGFVIEALLLSLALAERINRERRERVAAQALSLELYQQANEAKEREVKAQTELLAVERQAKAQLGQRVEERTIELKRALQALEAANSELATLSRIDSLTQLANRRHFDETLQREFKQAIRNQQPIAVILGDVDHFKRINDQYGHQAGDRCLQWVAQHWRAQARRPDDLAARYGGEELALILPGISVADALQIAEEVRSAIGRAACPYQGKMIAIAVSLGVCVGIPARHEEAEEYLTAADVALYRAKASGRNRVEIQPSQPASPTMLSATPTATGAR
jgi:diguanylate cyclase (GGDEF)-like protein